MICSIIEKNISLRVLLLKLTMLDPVDVVSFVWYLCTMRVKSELKIIILPTSVLNAISSLLNDGIILSI